MFSYFLHSHLLGRKIQIDWYRDGQHVGVFASDQNYDFNFQENRLLDSYKTILPVSWVFPLFPLSPISISLLPCLPISIVLLPCLPISFLPPFPYLFPCLLLLASLPLSPPPCLPLPASLPASLSMPPSPYLSLLAALCIPTCFPVCLPNYSPSPCLLALDTSNAIELVRL